MKASRQQTVVAAFLLVGILVALAFRLWASHESSTLEGPSYVAVSRQRVAIVVNQELHELSREGTFLQTYRFEDLQIRGPISDLQYTSKGDLLIGAMGSRAIFQCQLPQFNCERMAPALRNAIKSAFKFYAQEATNQLYITDTFRHRLLIQDFNGPSGVRELSTPGQLRYPNDIWVDEEENLLIADTNHHRIAKFTQEGEEIKATPWQIQAATEFSTETFSWPVSFAKHANRQFWVINAGPKLERREIILYNSNAKPIQRISLSDHFNPFHLVHHNGHILVSDNENFQFYQATATSADFKPFGDDRFQGLLASLRSKSRQSKQMATYALLAIGVLALLFFGLVVQIIRGGGGATLPRPDPNTCRPKDMAQYPAVQWLEPLPEALKSMRSVRIVLFVSLNCLFLGCGLILIASILKTGCSSALLVKVLLPILLVTLAFNLLLMMMKRAISSRVGTDGEYLYLSNHRKMAIQVRPEDVVFTHRQIAYGNFIVPFFSNQFQPLFSPQELAQHIYPLMEKGRKVTDGQMTLYVLGGRRSPAFWWLIAATVGLLALLIILPFLIL